MVELLSGIGFQIPHKPQGSFFVFAELPKEYACSDIYFVEQLIKQAGVVAVPGCGFFHSELRSEGLPELGPEYHRRYIRFAFCKSDATLTAASQRVKALVDSAGYLKLFSTNEI